MITFTPAVARGVKPVTQFVLPPPGPALIGAGPGAGAAGPSGRPWHPHGIGRKLTANARPNRGGQPGIGVHMSLDEHQLEAIKARINELQIEHRDLDDVVLRLSESRVVDQLRLRRLKKRKLLLKDQIERLRSMLIPDLDA